MTPGLARRCDELRNHLDIVLGDLMRVLLPGALWISGKKPDGLGWLGIGTAHAVHPNRNKSN